MALPIAAKPGARLADHHSSDHKWWWRGRHDHCCHFAIKLKKMMMTIHSGLCSVVTVLVCSASGCMIACMRYAVHNDLGSNTDFRFISINRTTIFTTTSWACSVICSNVLHFFTWCCVCTYRDPFLRCFCSRGTQTSREKLTFKLLHKK